MHALISALLRTNGIRAYTVTRRVKRAYTVVLIPTLVVFLCLQAGRVLAQASPPFVVQGPTIVQNSGCTLEPETFGGGTLTPDCVSISYDQSQPTSASIVQKRVVLVPRGNLQFEFPLISNIPKPSTRGARSNVTYHVTVTATGPNNANNVETRKNSGDVVLHDVGSAILQIPIIVDWAESSVTFEIVLTQEMFYGPCDPKVTNCEKATGNFTGPDLSSINAGLSWPVALSNDAFLVVGTPAAAFQIPLVPTTILYAPLGNGSQAKSTFTVTNIVGTNQGFSNSQGQIHGVTHDDKDQYQGGVTLSFSHDIGQGIVQGKSSTVKVSLGANFSGAWDNSTETDNEETYGRTGSVITENQTQVTYNVIPRKGLPSVDQVTWATQPFWQDVILAVTNAQYAIWDYPSGPIIQPLCAVSVVQLPVQQLQYCKNATNAIEPTSFVPMQWVGSQVDAPGTVLLDSNNQIQVATTSGTSGTAEPLPQWQANHIYSLNTVIIDSNKNKQTVTGAGISDNLSPTWSTAANGATNDNTVVWTNGGPANGWGFNDGDHTTDGTVTWTNENKQYGIYKGSAPQDAAQYIWLRTGMQGKPTPLAR